jgi:hypothetical protein
MRSRPSWMLPTCLLLLAGMAGCPNEANVTTKPISEVASKSGCRVERLDDAVLAVSNLFVYDDAHVYKIDGELATCKLEVLYRPDEESEEELVYSATSDRVADAAESGAKDVGITETHKNHCVLAIVLPGSTLRPNDEIVFSFVAQRKSSDESTVYTEWWWDSKKAKEIFPESLLAYDGPRGSTNIPVRSCIVKPGEEATIVDRKHHWTEQDESGKGEATKKHIVRYRVTVSCLEGDRLPDRGEGESGQENDEGESG